MEISNRTKNSIRRFAAWIIAFLLVFQYSVSGSLVYAWAEEEPALSEEQITEEEAKALEDSQTEEEPAPDAEQPERDAEQPESAPEEEAPEEKAEKPETAEKEAEQPETDEPEEDTKAQYPAQSFSGKTAGMTVKIAAPEGALPEGTTAEIKAASAALAAKKIEKAAGDTVKVIKAVEITFRNKDGKEIEPEKKVSVSFAYSEFGDIESPGVYHIDDNGQAEKLARGEVKANDNRVSITVKDFSIYAVTGEEVGARLTINFYSGDTLLDTMYVKAEDTLDPSGNSDSNLSNILYDPGIGTVASEQVFKGWARNEKDYTVDSEARTIEKIREEADNWNGTEDETWNMYAMIFNVYHVAFLDEKNVTIKGDTVIYNAGDTSVSYLINTDYTPINEDANFDGWSIGESSELTVTGPDNDPEPPFKYGKTVTLSGPSGASVAFTASAPTGQWLSFQENGHGASYTPPQFIKTGENTVEPEDPTRLGYEFKGWYEDEECTSEKFEFGETISSRTTLYAKWTPVPEAAYTVIIWQQNVDGNGYDFETSIQLDGKTNTAVDTITANGSGNERYASINGEDKRYTGFHLDRYDTEVNISPEGTSVVNVFYNRNVITINFYTFTDGSWDIYTTMSGLYGSTLADNKYTWPTEYNWYDQGSSNGGVGGTRLTFLDAFLPTEESTTLKYYAQEIPSGESRTITFYKQNADKQGYSVANTVSAAGSGGFYISDKYAGYQAYEYSVDGGAWTPAGEKRGGYYNGGNTVSFSSTLEIRFNRLHYNILFYDGAYFNGDGVTVEEDGSGKLREVDGISYGFNISEYNSYEPSGRAGYMFDGWYIDDACTQSYTFNSMPQGGLAVYAKWVNIQYRVFLHPNVPSDDTSLAWGQTSQQTSFRVDYGEKISGGHTIVGNRNEYELIGWYTDEACTKSFNFDAYALNETTVTTPYDKTKSTELDKYGEPTEDVNKDEERSWITKELDLYAKWRNVIEGADGIKVHYDAGDGTDAPVDSTTYYLDNAEAMAGAASTPKDESTKFMRWIIQAWDEKAEEYIDTDRYVYPGDTFEVLKKDAKRVVTEWADEDQTKIKSATYTVQLRAEYDVRSHEMPTHITWHANNGTGLKIEDPEAEGGLKINQEVAIRDADTFSYDGYEFAGWARYESGKAPTSPTDRSNLWLQYDSDSGDFKESGRKSVSKVAADERQPYHDLYAVWIAAAEIEIEGSTTEKVYNGLEQKTDIDPLFEVRYRVAGKYVDKLPEGVTVTFALQGDSDIKAARANSIPDSTDINAYGTDAGTYTTKVVAYLTSENPEYKVSSAKGEAVFDIVLNIARRPVTVKASDAAKLVGEEDPEFAWTAYGLAENDSIDVLDIRMTRESGEAEGKYSIIPAGETVQGNYTVNFENGTLTINTDTPVPEPGETPVPGQDPIPAPGTEPPEDQDTETDPDAGATAKPQHKKTAATQAQRGAAAQAAVVGPQAAQDIEEQDAPEQAPETHSSPLPKFFPTPSPYYWALMNLIIAIITVLLGMMILYKYLRKSKNKDKESQESKEERQQEVRKKSILKLIDVIPAVTAVITFMLSENMNHIMIMTDDYTPIMVFILLVEVVCGLFTKKSLKKAAKQKSDA